MSTTLSVIPGKKRKVYAGMAGKACSKSSSVKRAYFYCILHINKLTFPRYWMILVGEACRGKGIEKA